MSLALSPDGPRRLFLRELNIRGAFQLSLQPGEPLDELLRYYCRQSIVKKGILEVRPVP